MKRHTGSKLRAFYHFKGLVAEKKYEESLWNAKSGYFVARVPALKGCWSQGKTQEEAITNVKEAAAFWLEVEQDKKHPG